MICFQHLHTPKNISTFQKYHKNRKKNTKTYELEIKTHKRVKVRPFPQLVPSEGLLGLPIPRPPTHRARPSLEWLDKMEKSWRRRGVAKKQGKS